MGPEQNIENSFYIMNSLVFPVILEIRTGLSKKMNYIYIDATQLRWKYTIIHNYLIRKYNYKLITYNLWKKKHNCHNGNF